ncbi:RNA-binding cell elongation regulator Jag/EloR [Butyrivibrio sp. AE3009]|uniref:RNA-binding cell elongation regulator Jag/EloR n=1 Tax=Butyrivibrio sp. AE3009 TaxID=1280666 RepID=UPI0003B50A45|nr:RNA-binding cell elongation regulator Jag/EloR [Butyrivibrio sp. AE3009]
MEFKEFTAKNVDDAITEACESFGVPSDRLEYEVVSNGSAGFLGINAKPAIIKARIKEEKPEVVEEVKKPVENKPAKENKASKEVKEVKENKPAAVKTEAKKEEKKVSDVDGAKLVDAANSFLNEVFGAMKMEVKISAKYNENDRILDVELSGDEMGVLIGKRGQTLDSLQYLISLVVNRDSSDYIHVKVDTENYRERRKATLENLAKNISYKVRKSRQSVALEPMNPYERRIIHSALQNDRYVTTHSEGDEPFRRVVVTLKK